MNCNFVSFAENNLVSTGVGDTTLITRKNSKTDQYLFDGNVSEER